MATWREDIAEDIVGYIQKLDPSVSDEDEALLQTVEELLDRVLIYTNRNQLVEDYEEDLEDYPDITDDFWKNYDRYPIPTVMVRPLARIGLAMFKNISSLVNSTLEVKKIEDNGQAITYGSQLASFLTTKSDAEVFGGTVELLDKFRIADTVDNSTEF